MSNNTIKKTIALSLGLLTLPNSCGLHCCSARDKAENNVIAKRVIAGAGVPLGLLGVGVLTYNLFRNSGEDGHSRVSTSPADIGGLPNIGNSCYMNALVQQLYGIRKFRESIKSGSLRGASSEALKAIFEMFDSNVRITADMIKGFIRSNLGHDGRQHCPSEVIDRYQHDWAMDFDSRVRAGCAFDYEMVDPRVGSLDAFFSGVRSSDSFNLASSRDKLKNAKRLSLNPVPSAFESLWRNRGSLRGIIYDEQNKKLKEITSDIREKFIDKVQELQTLKGNDMLRYFDVYTLDILLNSPDKLLEFFNYDSAKGARNDSFMKETLPCANYNVLNQLILCTNEADFKKVSDCLLDDDGKKIREMTWDEFKGYRVLKKDLAYEPSTEQFVLSVGRIGYNGNFSGYQSGIKVDDKLELQSEYKLTNNKTYCITGVACHLGDGGGGHYISYRMLKDGRWALFNDDRVRVVAGGIDEVIRVAETNGVMIVMTDRDKLRSCLPDLNVSN